MKLADLHAELCRDTKGVIYALEFDCPACTAAGRKLRGECSWMPDGRIWVPLGKDGKGSNDGAGHLTWSWSGSSLEDITVEPSVHCVGHWHGWIKRGVVTTV